MKHTVRIWRTEIGQVEIDAGKYIRWRYAFTVDGETVDSMVSEIAGAIITGIQAMANTSSATEMSFEVVVP